MAVHNIQSWNQNYQYYGAAVCNHHNNCKIGYSKCSEYKICGTETKLCDVLIFFKIYILQLKGESHTAVYSVQP